jgi:hypothetical protein
MTTMTTLPTEQAIDSLSVAAVLSLDEMPNISNRAVELAEALNDVFESINTAAGAPTAQDCAVARRL